MIDTLDIEAGLGRAAKPLAWLLVAAFSLLLVWLAVRILWLMLDGPELAVAAPATAPAVAAQPAATARSIAAWHLFGNALPGPDLAALAQARETSLRLTLRGVLAEEDPALGIALIAEEGARERAFRVGEEVPGGARLEGVYPDRVALNRAGVMETLSLPRASGSPGTVRSASPGSPQAALRSYTPIFAQPQVLPGVDLAQATRGMAIDADRLARDISVLPVIEGGRFAGVRLSGGRDARILSQLGLRPTDVVTAVNGIQLDSLERGQQIAETLRESRSAQVTVRRDGRDVVLNINLNQ
ncbi:MAG TPA: type II secretion system protein GspC [Xanthomonadaceae bacterium]|nr:type II secretion system protein GspC [Xanthomonadaceae bacterium]